LLIPCRHNRANHGKDLWLAALAAMTFSALATIRYYNFA
jgi:hypothetical protein